MTKIKTEEELIKDGWYPVQTPSFHPCTNCEAGWTSFFGQTISVNGKPFAKSESCQATCKILADFNAKANPLPSKEKEAEK